MKICEFVSIFLQLSKVVSIMAMKTFKTYDALYDNGSDYISKTR